MKIEFRSIADIKPYPNNPRINDDAVDTVAGSIKEFGFRQPIVVDTDGVIICGHTRFKAAQKLGLEKVPVRMPLPPALNQGSIYENQTAARSRWFQVSAAAR